MLIPPQKGSKFKLIVSFLISHSNVWISRARESLVPEKTCLNLPVFWFFAKNMGKVVVFSMVCDDTKLTLTTMNYNDNSAKHSWPTNILVWFFVFRSLGDGRKMRRLQRVAENWGFGFWRNFFLHIKIKKNFQFFFSSSNLGPKRLSIFPKRWNIDQIS